MHQDFTQQAAAQMPQVAPRTLVRFLDTERSYRSVAAANPAWRHSAETTGRRGDLW
jgi:hypothetical protein